VLTFPSNTAIYDRLPSADRGYQANQEGTLAETFGSLEIKPVYVETQYAVMAVHCACGETTSVTMTGFDETEAFCPCGRTWKVRVTAEQEATLIRATVDRAAT
jgi:hypothetical protein